MDNQERLKWYLDRLAAARRSARIMDKWELEAFETLNRASQASSTAREELEKAQKDFDEALARVYDLPPAPS